MTFFSFSWVFFPKVSKNWYYFFGVFMGVLILSVFLPVLGVCVWTFFLFFEKIKKHPPNYLWGGGYKTRYI